MWAASTSLLGTIMLGDGESFQPTIRSNSLSPNRVVRKPPRKSDCTMPSNSPKITTPVFSNSFLAIILWCSRCSRYSLARNGITMALIISENSHPRIDESSKNRSSVRRNTGRCLDGRWGSDGAPSKVSRLGWDFDGDACVTSSSPFPRSR